MMIRSIAAVAAVTLLCGLNPVPAQAGETTLGIEGFHDNYQEPRSDILVNNHANYGSVTAGYESTGASDYFYGVQGRFSYGRNDYKSVSGVDHNVPQYEGEARALIGFKNNSVTNDIHAYTGIGYRGFLDKGGGTVTNLGFGGYDRHINQVYVPFGASDKMPIGGNWTFTPLAEYDQIVWGRVKSDISPYTGYDITNSQHHGFGARGELMFGQKLEHYSWEAGPYIRYWRIETSKVTYPPDGSGGLVEPSNRRTQIGAALRVSFD